MTLRGNEKINYQIMTENSALFLPDFEKLPQFFCQICQSGSVFGFSENDPITVGRIQFNDDKTMMFCELSVKRRKKGYLDMTMGLSTMLDSPYYF